MGGEGKITRGAADGTGDGGGDADELAKERVPLVGFGSFSVSKRIAAGAAAGGIAVLAALALVLAGIGGGAGDIELAVDDAQDGEAATQDAADTTGDSNTQDQTQDGDDITQTQDPSGTSSGQDSGSVASEPQPEPKPDPSISEMVSYEPPTIGEPHLANCTASRDDDGTVRYAVSYTVTSTGGTYDVLPGEPFLGNDQRLEIRGGELVWTVDTTHVRERSDDAEWFHVPAPSALGWAEPGSDVRQHAHQPPSLAVHVDQCPAG